MNRFYRNCMLLLRPLARLFFRLESVNEEKVPETGGIILCSNHISNFDPPLLGLALTKRQIHFMAKAELFHNKFFAKIFYKLGAFPINRGKGDTAGLRTAVELIESGRVMGMFPEGTRAHDGKPLRAKAGVALIAQQTGADILPVKIATKEGKVCFFRKVRIVCGDVIPNSELRITDGKPSELKFASNMIMERINSLEENL